MNANKLLQLGSSLNAEQCLKVGFLDKVVDIGRSPETTDFSALSLDDEGKILHEEAVLSKLVFWFYFSTCTICISCLECSSRYKEEAYAGHFRING